MSVSITLALYDVSANGLRYLDGSVVDAQNTAERVILSFANMTGRFLVRKVSMYVDGATTVPVISAQQVVTLWAKKAAGLVLETAHAALEKCYEENDADDTPTRWCFDSVLPFNRLIDASQGEVVEVIVPPADSNVSPTGTFFAQVILQEAG